MALGQDNVSGTSWRGRLVDLLYDPAARGIVFQIALVAGLVAFAVAIISNTITNLEKQHIASGFDFLGRTAGFDISQSLIEYSNVSSYGRAFWVGLLNTLLVAGLGILIATIIGFVVGIARLSSNWLIARLAGVYVEILRNIPPLLMLFAIYFAVLKTLPLPRDSIALPFSSYLNVRGLTVPMPIWQPGIGWVVTALALAILAVPLLGWWSFRRRLATGRTFPTVWVGAALVIGLPAIAFLLAGMPVRFDVPKLGRFNVTGGLSLLPELVALTTGLSLYTAAFIAEIVRAGIMAISKGQTEAAFALGLRPGRTMNLIILPQALRVIIPPLISQYLNLMKNSSLAIAVSYMDLRGTLGGITLNQTGRELECILLMMLIYLALSLLISSAMNVYNNAVKLKER